MWGARLLLARLFGARLFGATGSAVAAVAPGGTVSTTEGLSTRAREGYALTTTEGYTLRAREA